jgi:FkbM family methyltransferase
MGQRGGQNIETRLPISLFAKSLVVGTRFEHFSRELRWILGSSMRFRYPELSELFLEEKWLSRVLVKVLKNDSCCVDVGGHIGSFVSLAKACAPLGRHIVFEASRAKSRWLKKRFPDVDIFQLAVSDGQGLALFKEEYYRPGYSSIVKEYSPSSTISSSSSYEVQTCRLDDILADRSRIDLIKLDIEGGELAALRGCATILRKFRPIIIFECGTEYSLAKLNLSRIEIYEFLVSTMQYDIYCFGDFLYEKGRLSYDEFRKCGLYPFRALNFLALPR